MWVCLSRFTRLTFLYLQLIFNNFSKRRNFYYSNTNHRNISNFVECQKVCLTFTKQLCHSLTLLESFPFCCLFHCKCVILYPIAMQSNATGRLYIFTSHTYTHATTIDTFLATCVKQSSSECHRNCITLQTAKCL